MTAVRAPQTVGTAGAPAAGRARGTAVEFVDVVRDFGSTRALDGLSLAIEPGELMALLGPSGCGKTTALRILAGFDAPDGGRVLVDGQDVSATAAHRREMGMVFQGYSLFPTMTARDNVAFGLRVRGRGARERRTEADRLLDLVGLAAHAGKFPHEMSGGQQQRVALARALAVQPRVLLLDEPLSALDAKVRLQLRDEIRRLQLELGVTTVFVTHDQEEALSMADRIAVLRDGRVEQCARPAELYQRPSTAFVAEFVGTMNHLPATVEGGRVRVWDRSLPVDGVAPADGSAVVALVRPESVLLHPAAEAAAGTPLAVVVSAAFLGAVTRLRLALAGSPDLLVDVPSHEAGRWAAGSDVAVSVADRPVLVRVASGG